MLAIALGDAGNAMAWATPAVRDGAEEGLVKGVATDALLRAYPRFAAAQGPSRDARDAIASALVLIDAPSTLSRVHQAEAASTGAERAALGLLRVRLQRHPLRR